MESIQCLARKQKKISFIDPNQPTKRKNDVIRNAVGRWRRYHPLTKEGGNQIGNWKKERQNNKVPSPLYLITTRYNPERIRSEHNFPKGTTTADGKLLSSFIGIKAAQLLAWIASGVIDN